MNFALSTQLVRWQLNDAFQNSQRILRGLHQQPGSEKQQAPELVLHLVCYYHPYNDDTLSYLP